MISKNQPAVIDPQLVDNPQAGGSDFESVLNQLAGRIAEKINAPTIHVASMTFGELFTLYYERHAKVRNRCPRNAFYFFKVHGPRWASLPVNQIVRRDVQDWVDSLAASSPSAANRAVNVMSTVINWGKRRDLLPPLTNPCVGVDRVKLPSRQRFIAPEEFGRLAAAVNAESELFRDYFWLSLLTAARAGNVLAMRWDEIDFDLGTWTIPEDKFKTGSAHTLPLSAWAIEILQRRRGKDLSPWVLPSPRCPGAHLAGTKRSWDRVCKTAGVNDLHIHDLRRTHASYMAISGENQYVIAQMLGHKDTRSTAVYARLSVGPVRAAAEKFASKLQSMSETRSTEMSRGEEAPSLPKMQSAKPLKNSRTRQLSQDELTRFISAVHSLSYKTSVDCFLSLLWTRQRRRIVMGMQWEQLDLKNGTWNIPQTTTSAAQCLDLEPEIVSILKVRQMSHDRHCVWVFPKRDGSGPVWCLDTAWSAILHRSGVANLRIDDLRGTDLAMIRACMPSPRVKTVKKVQNDVRTELPSKKTLPIERVGFDVQARIETMITDVLKAKQLTKSEIAWRVNRFKISGIELQRILDELLEKGLIVRYVESPHAYRVWQYAINQ